MIRSPEVCDTQPLFHILQFVQDHNESLLVKVSHGIHLHFCQRLTCDTQKMCPFDTILTIDSVREDFKDTFGNLLMKSKNHLENISFLPHHAQLLGSECCFNIETMQ